MQLLNLRMDIFAVSAGIAGLLNVLSIRLGRVVDRVRVVETRRTRETHEDHRALLQAETNSLWNRIRLVDWSFRSLVAGALIVCLVIMALFLSELSHLNFSPVIAFLFVASRSARESCAGAFFLPLKSPRSKRPESVRT